jgi:hypothetical protein
MTHVTRRRATRKTAARNKQQNRPKNKKTKHQTRPLPRVNRDSPLTEPPFSFSLFPFFFFLFLVFGPPLPRRRPRAPNSKSRGPAARSFQLPTHNTRTHCTLLSQRSTLNAHNTQHTTHKSHNTSSTEKHHRPLIGLKLPAHALTIRGGCSICIRAQPSAAQTGPTCPCLTNFTCDKTVRNSESPPWSWRTTLGQATPSL